eukprot:10661902-Alexandrium_andersonii.AAC.1
MQGWCTSALKMQACINLWRERACLYVRAQARVREWKLLVACSLAQPGAQDSSIACEWCSTHVGMGTCWRRRLGFSG